MELDLAQVRAFVALVDRPHFGHAADELSLSQQALSKRIARLERTLGVRLFVRDRRSVRLTDDGRRFLEPARRVLAAGDSAVAAVRTNVRPLRIDVWGHLYAPMRTVGHVVDRAPHLDIEPGRGRDLPTVVDALRRGEIDTGFGRVPPTEDREGDAPSRRLVRLEPVDAVLGVDHPLADASELRPAQLHDSRLWFPAATDRLDFLRRFSDRFRIPRESVGANLGLEHFLADVRADPARFSLIPADVPLPETPGIRTVPLVGPTPLYAWSLIWFERARHPRLGTLLRAFAEVGKARRWLDYDPARDWLPEGTPP